MAARNAPEGGGGGGDNREMADAKWRDIECQVLIFSILITAILLASLVLGRANIF